MRRAVIGLLLALLPGAASATPPPLVAQTLVLIEWRKAENRKSCAPIAFSGVGRGGWNARRADFSGGWAVAFDVPGQRGAFGVAGTGLLPGDAAPIGDQRAALAAQWPYVRALPKLRPESFAGFGIEGAKPLPADNPEGRGEKMLAYVRAPGERCLYNVWTTLGRRHLWMLLDGLKFVLIPVRR